MGAMRKCYYWVNYYGIQLNNYSTATTYNGCDKTQRTNGPTEKTTVQVIAMTASDKSTVKQLWAV